MSPSKVSADKPVLLLLGAGPNIGASVAKTFAADGYEVVLTSRKASQDGETPYLHVQGDLSDPTAVPGIFEQCRKIAGEPSVVVYNAGAVGLAPKEKPFDFDLATFQDHLNINTTSAFVAIKEAVASFGTLPTTASRTFIYTGNAMNFASFPGIMTLGTGKSASAHMLSAAAVGYSPRGFKFYYADERQANGKLGGKGISGEAHAQLYKHLSDSKEQEPWLQTFVKGAGYVNFPPDTNVTFG